MTTGAIVKNDGGDLARESDWTLVGGKYGMEANDAEYQDRGVSNHARFLYF